MNETHLLTSLIFHEWEGGGGERCSGASQQILNPIQYSECNKHRYELALPVTLPTCSMHRSARFRFLPTFSPTPPGAREGDFFPNRRPNRRLEIEYEGLPIPEQSRKLFNLFFEITCQKTPK